MSATNFHSDELGQLAKLAAHGEDMAVLESFTAKRPSVEEHLAAGKALREKVPRADHARYHARPHREDPVAILERQNETRVQKLVPVRYARMLASPFAFLRGSAAVMAADLAGTPATGLFVKACGDMHVANFGVFASAERNLVFGINDFDEIHPGPWEWDLKRLAASAAVAARFMGGDKDEAADAARAIVRSYRKRIRRYAEMGYLEVWYDRIDDRAVLDTLSPKVRRRAERVLDKARAKGHVQVLDKLTEQVDGEHRIIENVPLIVRETHTEAGTPIDEALDRAAAALSRLAADDRRRLLSRYRIVDVARKVVGVGSVGTAAGWSCSRASMTDDPLFLQVKEAQPSVLAPYVDYKLPFDNQGQARGGRPAPDPGLAGHLPRLGRNRRQALLRPPARRHEGRHGLRRRQPRPADGVRGILRPVRLGAGAGPRQVGRRGADRRLLRQQQRTRRRHRQVRARLCQADRQGP